MDYFLRKIDPDLWARAKARATREGGIPMRALIFALLELYAAGRISVKSSIKAQRT